MKTYETQPDYVSKEILNSKEFKFALCYCPVGLNYALIIPKEYTKFRCKKCGLVGKIY